MTHTPISDYTKFAFLPLFYAECTRQFEQQATAHSVKLLDILLYTH